MTLFLQELTEVYKHATIAPGLQIAWLADKEKFYVAVHIFPAGLASRTVIAKALEDTLPAALDKVKEVWRIIYEQIQKEKNG